MSGKAGWTGLVAQLNAVQQSDAHDAPAVGAPDQPVAEVQASRPKPVSERRAQAPKRRKRRASFADTHHLVGVYFPLDLEDRFRAAAEDEGISNSEFVVRAVSEYLDRADRE